MMEIRTRTQSPFIYFFSCRFLVSKLVQGRLSAALVHLEDTLEPEVKHGFGRLSRDSPGGRIVQCWTLTLIPFRGGSYLAKLVGLVGQLNCGRSIPFSWDFLPS